MAAFAALLRRRGSHAPLGAHDVRLLATPDALRLAETAAILAAMDQALQALTELRARSRRPSPGTYEAGALVEVALLRHGVVQFLDCFDAARSLGLLDEAAFGGSAEARSFYRHLRAFRDQLSGPHARLVGETQTVALLRRMGDRPVLAGLATRTRRPDRLTPAELAQLLAFFGRARAACARRLEEMRASVLDHLRRLPVDELEALPPASEV
jgi:hypothetical protein